eukprot:scaffold9751_cov247-Amphora_coffeaeformis.AAC.1
MDSELLEGSAATKVPSAALSSGLGHRLGICTITLGQIAFRSDLVSENLLSQQHFAIQIGHFGRILGTGGRRAHPTHFPGLLLGFESIAGRVDD